MTVIPNRALLIALMLGCNCAAAAAAGSRSADESSIRQLEADQAAAWNAHDATRYAKLFTARGDVVNVMGWWWRGRAEIQGKLALAFGHAFRDSTLTITEIDVRFLTDNFAIAHVKWTMSGAIMPPGLPVPKAGIQLQVLRKQSGQWLIENFQNTNSLPEQSFPRSAPADSKSP